MKLSSCLTLSLFAAVLTMGNAQASTEIQIYNRSTGQQLPTYKHNGQLWVAGKPGDRYSVTVSNSAWGRILAVVSVDGINVVSGDTAATNQRGYVLSPKGSVDIAGWRKSDRDVAAFYFTSVDDSYAGKTHRPDHVGVIGVATFREYQEPVPAPVQESSSEGASAMRSRDSSGPAAPAAAKAENKLGTGHGERIYSPSERIEFKRASSTPDEVITIRYDSYANLVAKGIIRGARRPAVPQAFPGNYYVPDPS